MRPPRSIKIGPVRYGVREVREIVTDDGRELAGEIRYRQKAIRFDHQYMRESGQGLTVLLHEVIHGISEDRGLRLTERETEQVARGLHQVIADNGWTLRFGRGA